jgi:hypothetical protein
MTIAIARAMLGTPRTRSSFDHINDNHAAFVWDDNGEEVEQWNAIAGAAGAGGGADVTAEGDGESRPRFRYKGAVVEVPILYERGDNTISVHTLAQLVKQDSDIRMCLDTCWNSEYAYLPLPPAAWAQLEAEFGREAVAFRFLALPPKLGDFYEAVGNDGLMQREYPDEPVPEPSPSAKRMQELGDQVRAILLPAYPGLHLSFYSFPINNTFGLRATSATEAARERLRGDSASLLRLKPLVEAAGRDLGFQFRGINFVSEETRRRDHPDDPLAGIFDAGEIPAAWEQAPPAQRVAAPTTTPVAALPGAIGVTCAHCGTAFKAVPRISVLGFRRFTCPACGKSFQRGLGWKMRPVCWALLGLTVWFWAQQPSDTLLLALLYFGGMVLADLFQLSKRAPGR